MKAQKIIATIVAIAISSAGFAKEVTTRPNAVQAKKAFNSKVFDVDNNHKIQAVELSKQEMQETEGEFLPLIAIGLGAIAFGMWIKHGENYAKTGEPASVKEVAKAGAIEGATSAIPGGSAIGTVKKVEAVAKVTKAVSNTKKTTNAVNTVNNTKKIANTTTNYAPKTTKQMAEDVAKKYNTNSVRFNTAERSGRIDLRGRAHTTNKKTNTQIETPHSQWLTRNIRPQDGKVFLNNNGEIKAATNQDIRIADRLLKQQLQSAQGIRKRGK